MAVSPGGSHRTPLLGRAEVLDRLLQSLKAVQEGPYGRLTLVTGGRGMGKSRIAAAVYEMAREAGLQRVRIRVTPRTVPRAFDLFSDLTTDISEAGAEWERAIAPPGRDAPIALSGAIARSEPEEDTLAQGPRLETIARAPLHLHEQVDEWRRRAETRVREWITRVSYRGSLLFLIEDLHLADEESRQLVARLLPSLLERPIWVVVTAESTAPIGAEFEKTVAELTAADRVNRVALSNLTRTETERFAQAIEPPVAGPLSKEQIDQIYALSKGNPFLIERLLPYIRQGRGTSAATPARPPTGVADLFRRLVTAVPSRDRRVLAYAAVIGPIFDFHLLSRATGEEEEALAEAVERLHGGGLLVEQGPDRFAFLTSTVRDITYNGLSQIRRRILHQKIARAIETDGHAEDPSWLVELANHYALGGEPERACAAYVRAADRAAGQLDIRFAAECIRRCYDLERSLNLGTPADRARRLDRLALLWRQAGDSVRERESAEEAVRLLEAYPTAPRLAAHHSLALARALIDTDDLKRARTLLEQALPVLESEGEEMAVSDAYRFLGHLNYTEGNYTDSLSFYHLARDAMGESAPPSELGRATLAIADAQLMLDPQRPEKARRWYDRAVRLLRDGDDRPGLLFAHIALAAAAKMIGWPEERERAVAAATQAAGELPLASRMVRAMTKKVQGHLNRGEARVGEALLDVLEPVTEAGSDSTLKEQVRLAHAEALLLLDQDEEARRRLEPIELKEREADRKLARQARLLLGLIHFRKGEEVSSRRLLSDGPPNPHQFSDTMTREILEAQRRLGLLAEDSAAGPSGGPTSPSTSGPGVT